MDWLRNSPHDLPNHKAERLTWIVMLTSISANVKVNLIIIIMIIANLIS